MSRASFTSLHGEENGKPADADDPVAGHPVIVDLVKRQAATEDIIGRRPFLDDEGSGMARTLSQVHGMLKAGRWVALLLVGAVVTNLGLHLSDRVLGTPAEHKAHAQRATEGH